MRPHCSTRWVPRKRWRSRSCWESSRDDRFSGAGYHRAMVERKTHLDSRAISLLLVCCLFWGLQQLLIKTTVVEVPPLWQAALRFVGATVLLWIWCAVRGVRLFERDGTLPAGLLAGALFA